MAARKARGLRPDEIHPQWPALDDSFDLSEADQLDLGDSICGRLKPGRALVEDYAQRFLVHPAVSLKARTRIFLGSNDWEMTNETLLGSFYEHPLLSLELETLEDMETREAWSCLIISETSSWFLESYKHFPVYNEDVSLVLTEKILPLCMVRSVKKGVFQNIHEIYNGISLRYNIFRAFRFSLTDPRTGYSVSRVIRVCLEVMQEIFTNYNPSYKRRTTPHFLRFVEKLGA